MTRANGSTPEAATDAVGGTVAGDDNEALRERVGALAAVVEDLREEVDDLEAENQALREENDRLRSTVETLRNDVDANRTRAKRNERALFPAQSLNSEKEAAIEAHDALTNLVWGDDFEAITQLREDLQAERAYRTSVVASIRAKLEALANAVDVDLGAPDEEDPIGRLLFRGPGAVTDTPGKVHQRARAILRHPEWGSHSGHGRVKWRASEVRKLLSAMESQRSDLDAKTVHRAFDKLVDLADGYARTVRTTTERDGRQQHRVLDLQYTSREYERVTEQ